MKGLFYLRSRGVSEAEARRMLSHAFMTDVLERITNERIGGTFIAHRCEARSAMKEFTAKGAKDAKQCLLG